ncbi:uncharacterized protein LOC142351779 [Convolutriloba macropyga]|uniref:uncharacterized protein LOC142351779 n=1 Tax=Convolutriloba macropyga TaxID=536237 RepID=UPI003F525243
MPGIGEKTVLEVLRRTMQSDSKTDQKNKQQQVLLKGHHGKIDKDNFVYQQGYLKERARCLQEVRKSEIELSFLREHISKQQEKGADNQGPGRFIDEHTPEQKADDIFKTVIPKEKRAAEVVGGGDESSSLGGEGGDAKAKQQLIPANIRRMQLLQKEHDKQVNRRLVKFAATIETETDKRLKKRSIEQLWMH